MEVGAHVALRGGDLGILGAVGRDKLLVERSKRGRKTNAERRRLLLARHEPGAFFIFKRKEP